MIGVTVTFILVLLIPGEMPSELREPVKNIFACMEEVHAYLIRPSHHVLINGGIVRVSCVVEVPPSLEH